MICRTSQIQITEDQIIPLTFGQLGTPTMKPLVFFASAMAMQWRLSWSVFPWNRLRLTLQNPNVLRQGEKK